MRAKNGSNNLEADMDLGGYQAAGAGYAQLSIRDLLDARDQYHIHLMRHPNVVATAIGRYRIRNGDSWPDSKGPGSVHGNGRRTLENSAVRPYSWPAILVFVSTWEEEHDFASSGGKYTPDQLVPKTLYLPDGRKMPVCVIEAPKEIKSEVAPTEVQFPLNNIGGGNPIIVNLQGRKHFATVACLVSDGHKAYALTNRHVTGEAGEILYSQLGGRERRVGVTASKQLTRIAFRELYPGWAGKDVFVNLDVGMIDIDDLNDWTAHIREVGVPGPMADLSVDNISLALIGARVRGYGAATGRMDGEIHALFYRYKSQGGFEYVSDLFIGPRTTQFDSPEAAKQKYPPFSTHPGDSGTLWLLEPREGTSKENGSGNGKEPLPPLPLAMQWGENTLYSGEPATPQGFALATLLSRVCALLEIDPVRDWNLDQPNTWGALGHFSIASRAQNALSARQPRLVELMGNNANLITPPETELEDEDKEFKGMGDAAFVPLSDVPDFYWKHGKQGASRALEGPNHFADMDQPRDSDGKTLLKLCKDDANIDPTVWNEFYDSVTDLLSGEAIEQKHRGLLPFRVWQIFDEMVGFARNNKPAQFACAAGVLAHYVADACQPLHISYLHDGDPLQAVTRTVKHRNGTTSDVSEPLGKGVHSAYEDAMVSAMRKDILKSLKQTRKVTKAEQVDNGFQAAKLTIKLMTDTFNAIKPATLVDAYVKFGKSSVGRAEFMEKKFGAKTIQVMQDGTHLLAVLWESAWAAGDGETNVTSAKAMTRKQAMDICADRDFLPSLSIQEVAGVLVKP